MDDVLSAERAHLDASRAALAQMRAHTASLEALAGDRLSGEYLKQALYRRMMSLRDDPTVPLFFGRLDYRQALGGEDDETCYIGRLHVTRESGSEPLVYDWRAPISLPFYRGSRADPMGVSLRRRFGFHRGDLTAYEDEELAETADEPFGHSAILEAEIERPRTGPMRDIVATIQPEQDAIVRAPLATSLAVQGAPGTGKTAVGLHRAAFLLYAYREQLSRSGVLVVGPNQSFLSYIGDVLPALGEIDATQETVSSLVSRGSGLVATGSEPAEVAVLKGDPRMAEVLRRAVWGQLVTPTQTLVVPRGSSQWRIPAHRLADLIDELRTRGVRYLAGREMLAQRVAHHVLLRMEAAGESPDDRVQSAVARSRPVRAFVDHHWPGLEAHKVVWGLLTQPDALQRAAEGVLTDEERALLQQGRRPGSARSWPATDADLVLVDEANDLLTRTPSLGHVIIDEAQDLSAMQLRAVGRRASTGSMTLLGDLAQATTPWALTSWSDTWAALGRPEGEITELTAGFRVPGSVIQYAARLLPHIAPTLAPPHSVRRSRGDFEVRRGGLAELTAATVTALSNEGTVGVIVPRQQAAAVRAALEQADLSPRELGADADVVDSRLDLVPADLAKGLEFDHVVLADPAGIVLGEPDRLTGLRRLYVCLTRAVSGLVIVHQDELPAELR